MKKKIITLSIIFILVLSSYIFISHTSYGCKLQNGRWASNGSYCVTRNCYSNKSCGLLANPQKNCSKLKVSDDISKVYFLLGNPESIDDKIYKWYVFKGSDKFIEVIIVKAKVEDVKCGK